MFFDLRNKIDFAMRNIIKFSRKDFSLKNENKDGLFNGEACQKERHFASKYNLQKLINSSTQRNYCENLYTIELLESFLKLQKTDSIAVLDIGSKNWFYAQGEHAFFKKHSNQLQLDGIELDAWRVYTNLYSRYDVAQFHIRNLSGTNYIAGDFLKHQGEYDYIVWILPFITPTPLQAWGLPKKYFQPKELLKKAYADLTTGGKMIIVNQGEKEYEVQQKLFNELEIPHHACGEFKSTFLSYEHKRFVSVVSKA